MKLKKKRLLIIFGIIVLWSIGVATSLYSQPAKDYKIIFSESKK